MEINYVLFTHLPDEIRSYNVREDKAWPHFEKFANKLGDLLSDQEASGMLMIFTEPGWLHLLNIIGQDFNPVRLAEDFVKIKKREDDFHRIIDNSSLKGRARLITAETLYPILNNIRGNKSGETSANLKKYLVAEKPGVRYDTTKVVEAIIRIRHLGTGIPVIRMDWDALFNDNTLSRDLPLVTRDIPKRCELLSKDHLIYSYMVSGSYEVPSKKQEWTINEYNTAFATRMFPALISTNNAIKILDDSLFPQYIEEGISYDQDGELDENKFSILEADGMFDLQVMEKYYDCVSAMGSKRFESVISGAALVLSDGAILDLPPFSNFRWNVMWIDDYLKYELHRALGHFEGKFGNQPEVPGRLNEYVYKDRPLAGQNNLRPYTLGSYIPTLFFGIIMDSWIRAENGKTSFVTALEKSLRCGTFPQQERHPLIKLLLDDAIKRVQKLVKEWKELRTVTDKSFAALWVESDRTEIQRILSNIRPIPDEKWLGWGLLKKPATNVSSIDDLRPVIATCLTELAEDMCNYIEWTLYWPNFVQSVRAVKIGEIKLDVSFSKDSE